MSKAPKAKLQAMVAGRCSAKEHPGYFTDSGEFVRGPFYSAKIGSQVVALVGSRGYRQDIGFYISRRDALEGAKALKAKARQWLAEGNYAEGEIK